MFIVSPVWPEKKLDAPPLISPFPTGLLVKRYEGLGGAGYRLREDDVLLDGDGDVIPTRVSEPTTNRAKERGWEGKRRERARKSEREKESERERARKYWERQTESQTKKQRQKAQTAAWTEREGARK